MIFERKMNENAGDKEGNSVIERGDEDELSVEGNSQNEVESEASQPQVTEQETESEKMSKRAQKRLKKHERWLQLKAEKRKEEKIKKKRKFAEARERGDNMGPSRKALKKNSMVQSNCKVRVVIDCSFDSYMSEKDVRHLVQQIQHSYSANRRADNPLQFYVCGVNGKAQQRLEQIGDYKGWDVNFKSENYHDIFSKEDIVYLSSDSDSVLKDLDDNKVYIIGGLVDHNHHKGLCHELAVKKGVSHAQLPISEYIDMKTRKVLTVNHVFEILLRYTETKDWGKAFFQVLPQRKGAHVKEDEQNAPDKQASPLKEESSPSCAVSDLDSCENNASKSSVACTQSQEQQSDTLS